MLVELFFPGLGERCIERGEGGFQFCYRIVFAISGKKKTRIIHLAFDAVPAESRFIVQQAMPLRAGCQRLDLLIIRGDGGSKTGMSQK